MHPSGPVHVIRRAAPALLATASLAVAVAALPAAAAGANPLAGTGWRASLTTGPVAGSWGLRFASAAGFAITRQTGGAASTVVRGGYRVSGTTITFGDTAGPLECPARQRTGRYRFRLTGGGRFLSFTRVTDPCLGRRTVLTGARWRRG
jgi:hypothetical protein